VTAPSPTRLTLYQSSFFPSADNDSASITLSAGDVITVDAQAWQFTGSDCITSISGQGSLSGLSFTAITNAKYNAASFDYPVRSWVCVVGTGGTGTIRVVVDTGTCADVQFEVIRWANADTTTPIVTSATATGADNATAGPITIADRGGANNVRHAFFNTAASFSAATPGSGYTELTETNGNGSGFYSQYGATDTDPSFTSSANNGNTGWSGVVYEVKESAGGGGGATEGLTGQAASIATAVGSLGILDTLALTGAAAAIAAAIGTLAPGSSVTLTGAAAALATAIGTPGLQSLAALTGSNAGVATAAGTIGTSVTANTQLVVGDGTSFVGYSMVGPTSGISLSGSNAGIATAVGSFTLTDTLGLTGAAASIATAVGTLGPVDTVALTGAPAAIVGNAGSLGAPLTLTGAAASIATAAGSFYMLQLTGQNANIATGIGAFAGIPQQLTGSNANISTATGALGVTGDFAAALTGSGASLLAQVGAFGVGDSVTLTGAAAGILASAGTLVAVTSTTIRISGPVSVSIPGGISVGGVTTSAPGDILVGKVSTD
jgi:hypothetical protein